MNNLKDWCISRQIWFGHRIPVWYCQNQENPNCQTPIVGTEAPQSCPNCKQNNLIQDEDTLDTWFSSALWTFTTLGWPEKTPDLEYFHPTSLLETGHDILFFWVARMILMTTYNLNQVPFKQVYLHGLVLDKNGKKMSKSKGNGIDPLEMINKFGTDAVRLSLVIGTSPGNDLKLYEEKIETYRNFTNKIWNGSRFVLMNLSEEILNDNTPLTPNDLKSAADHWIVSKLQKFIENTTQNLEKYQLSEAGLQAYDFFWNEFCSWYIEFSKANKNEKVLKYLLVNLLKLLHPFIPFITETIWENLNQPELLISSTWPKSNPSLIFNDQEVQIDKIQNLITEIRSIRSEKKVEPSKKIKAIIYANENLDLIQQNEEILKQMARIEELEIEKSGPKVEKAIWKIINGIEVYLPFSDLFDQEEEIKRINKKIEENAKKIEYYTSKLSNETFRQKAPADLIESEQRILDELTKEQSTLKNSLQELN